MKQINCTEPPVAVYIHLTVWKSAGMMSVLEPFHPIHFNLQRTVLLCWQAIVNSSKPPDDSCQLRGPICIELSVIRINHTSRSDSLRSTLPVRYPVYRYSVLHVQQPNEGTNSLWNRSASFSISPRTVFFRDTAIDQQDLEVSLHCSVAQHVHWELHFI